MNWRLAMSIADVLPAVRSLSRVDKLQLIQLLAAGLAQDEESAPIVAGPTYPLCSPDRAYDAAAGLLRFLEAEGARP